MPILIAGADPDQPLRLARRGATYVVEGPALGGRLDRVASRDSTVVIDAALATFCCFETWMDGWEAAGNA